MKRGGREGKKVGQDGGGTKSRSRSRSSSDASCGRERGGARSVGPGEFHAAWAAAAAGGLG